MAHMLLFERVSHKIWVVLLPSWIPGLARDDTKKSLTASGPLPLVRLSSPRVGKGEFAAIPHRCIIYELLSSIFIAHPRPLLYLDKSI